MLWLLAITKSHCGNKGGAQGAPYDFVRQTFPDWTLGLGSAKDIGATVAILPLHP